MQKETFPMIDAMITEHKKYTHMKMMQNINQEPIGA